MSRDSSAYRNQHWQRLDGRTHQVTIADPHLGWYWDDELASWVLNVTNNIAIGYQAIMPLTSGSHNTRLGAPPEASINQSDTVYEAIPIIDGLSKL